MKALLGLTLAIALVAIGCGGGGAGSAFAGSGTNSPGGSQSSAAPSVSGDTLTVSSPANNATVPSAVPFAATAASPSGISGMVINVDCKDMFSTYSARINTTLALPLGSHAVIVKAWDNRGNYFAKPLNVTVRGDGRTQWLQTPFEAGVAHVGGAYGFQNNNFLLEGAQRIASLGSHSIFVYLDPAFRSKYPDRADHQWPGSDPASIAELAKTPPYQKIFGMNFRTIALTVNSFANRDNLAAFINDPNAAAAEEQEFYDLSMYLFRHYAGTGKTFILKNWEGDWFTIGSMNPAGTTSPQMLKALIVMCQARQRGVARARKDSGSPLGVAVFHAVEVNRVLDVSRRGMQRVINAVIPAVKPDMVTYSSYDSTSLEGSAAPTVADMQEAIAVIKKFTPDPLGLGDRRILISEYGDSEEMYPRNVGWRPQVVLQTAKAEGLSGAFVWQVFDNECKDHAGNDLPPGTPPGAAGRPGVGQCLGDWLVRPDGSLSPTAGVLAQYWKN